MKLVDGLALVNETRKNVPVPFCMEFYSFNRKQGTGGELQKVESFIGAASNHDAIQNGTITIKPAFGKSHPITVHIRLIKSINGKRIFW